jgi:hypothetical protein
MNAVSGLSASKQTFKAAELLYITQYYKCDREKEIYEVSEAFFPSDKHTRERWKPVPLHDKKYPGEIRHFYCWYDRSKDYYMLYEASDDVEDQSPKRIEKSTVQAYLRDSRYQEVSKEYIDQQMKDLRFCNYKDYVYLQNMCMPEEYEYLQRQLPSIDKKSIILPEVTDRIEILAKRLGKPQPGNPGLLKKVGLAAMLHELHDLSLETPHRVSNILT